MIVGVSYENGEVILQHADGDEERVPFTPSMLLPHALAPYIPHHLTTRPAPGGLYVEAPYPTLLRLYARLSSLSTAIVFPPPERQYLLLTGKIPFTEGLTPSLPTYHSALFHLLLTPSTKNPALTFLENVLFLHGHARPLLRKYRVTPDPRVFDPFFRFNVEGTTLSDDGEILLPTSPVRVRGYFEIHSVHPRLGRRVISGEGTVTLADAVARDIDYELIREIRTSSIPSFLHVEIRRLIDTFFTALHSLPDTLTPPDPTPYNLLLASAAILRGLPDVLLNTDVLTPRARDHLLALLNLLRNHPNVYNLLSPQNDTCCPDLSALVSYLPALSSLLTEPLPS